jgi:hypothetical protein
LVENEPWASMHRKEGGVAFAGRRQRAAARRHGASQSASHKAACGRRLRAHAGSPAGAASLRMHTARGRPLAGGAAVGARRRQNWRVPPAKLACTAYTPPKFLPLPLPNAPTSKGCKEHAHPDTHTHTHSHTHTHTHTHTRTHTSIPRSPTLAPPMHPPRRAAMSRCPRSCPARAALRAQEGGQERRRAFGDVQARPGRLRNDLAAPTVKPLSGRAELRAAPI